MGLESQDESQESLPSRYLTTLQPCVKELRHSTRKLKLYTLYKSAVLICPLVFENNRSGFRARISYILFVQPKLL